MVTKLAGLRVFVASPKGLDGERELFRREVLEVNEDEANRRGIAFIPVEWSLTRGGIGRPQARINAELRSCDYLILILHDKWGTPPSRDQSAGFTSGTEEEFNLALECMNSPDAPMRDVLVLFKGVEPSRMMDPGRELTKVLRFRASLDAQNELLYFPFDNSAEFRRLLRRHLLGWIRDFELSGIPAPRAGSARESIPTQLPAQPSDSPETLLAKGRITEAERAFAETMSAGPTLEECEQYLDFLQRSGRFALLKSTADEFLAEARAARAEYSVARICTKLGQALRRQGHLEDSERYLREAVVNGESCRDEHPTAVTQALDHLGLTLRRLGRLRRAEQHFGRAMRSHQIRHDRAGLGRTLTNLALVHRDRENFSRALTILEHASRLLEQSDFPQRLAIAFSALGTVQIDLGLLDDALRSFSAATERNLIAEDEYGAAIVLGQRARAFLKMADYDAARDDAEHCLELNERYNSQEGMATALMLLGQILLKQDRPDAASLYLLQAHETFEAVRYDEGTIISGADLAVSLARENRFADAQHVILSTQSRVEVTQVTLARSYFDIRYRELLELAQQNGAELAENNTSAGCGNGV
jgi:tetratricopeptide (TPR) repeat protein